jgi:putative alpha-1,2-mannosidase
MKARIDLAGGEGAFIDLLDRFFGFGADPVKQLGERPTAADLAAGYALNRFEGLNNEPDMEAPWAYHYAGRPDRTAEVVHAVVHNMFGLGRGGLPGNDDSGGLSSWYVWASLGLFPVAGQSLYLINAPSFAESRIAFADKELLIETSGFVEPVPGGPTQYVQSATFNGETLDRTWLTARELHRGGHLRIELGPHQTGWAAATRPPSVSKAATNFSTAATADPTPASAAE